MQEHHEEGKSDKRSRCSIDARNKFIVLLFIEKKAHDRFSKGCHKSDCSSIHAGCVQKDINDQPHQESGDNYVKEVPALGEL